VRVQQVRRVWQAGAYCRTCVCSPPLNEGLRGPAPPLAHIPLANAVPASLLLPGCSTHTELRGELSPVKKQARQFEHELGLARQETMVRAEGWLEQGLAST